MNNFIVGLVVFIAGIFASWQFLSFCPEGVPQVFRYICLAFCGLVSVAGIVLACRKDTKSDKGGNE